MLDGINNDDGQRDCAKQIVLNGFLLVLIRQARSFNRRGKDRKGKDRKGKAKGKAKAKGKEIGRASCRVRV